MEKVWTDGKGPILRQHGPSTKPYSLSGEQPYQTYLAPLPSREV